MTMSDARSASKGKRGKTPAKKRAGKAKGERKSKSTDKENCSGRANFVADTKEILGLIQKALAPSCEATPRKLPPLNSKVEFRASTPEEIDAVVIDIPQSLDIPDFSFLAAQDDSETLFTNEDASKTETNTADRDQHDCFFQQGDLDCKEPKESLAEEEQVCFAKNEIQVIQVQVQNTEGTLTCNPGETVSFEETQDDKVHSAAVRLVQVLSSLDGVELPKAIAPPVSSWDWLFVGSAVLLSILNK